MKFCIDDYPGKYVMQCESLEEASVFLNYLHGTGRKWSSGRSYSSGTNVQGYGGETCYNFNRGTYGHLDEYLDDGYTILQFNEFDWEENGDPREINFEHGEDFEDFLRAFSKKA